MASDKLILELTNDEAHILLSCYCHGAYAFGIGGTSEKDSDYPKELKAVILAVTQAAVDEHKAGVSSLNKKIDMLADQMEY